MPVDGRLKESRTQAPAPKFNGHSPRNVPLAADGLPDFDAMPSPDHRPAVEPTVDPDEEEETDEVIERTLAKMKPNRPRPKPEEDF